MFGCAMPSSTLAAMKLVPLSDRICLAGPLIAKNLRIALMQLEVSIDSMTSMCTPLVVIHVKSIAHLLLFAAPPHVRRVTTDHGPNTSNPTYENGGHVSSLSGGRSAIF